MKKDWEVFQVQPGEISDDDYSKGKELFDTSDPTLIKLENFIKNRVGVDRNIDNNKEKEEKVRFINYLINNSDISIKNELFKKQKQNISTICWRE